MEEEDFTRKGLKSCLGEKEEGGGTNAISQNEGKEEGNAFHLRGKKG